MSNTTMIGSSKRPEREISWHTIKKLLPDALVVLALLPLVLSGIQRAGWPEDFTTFLGYFTLCNIVFAAYLAWVCQAADLADRRLVLSQLMWLLWPVIVVANLYFFTPILPLRVIPTGLIFDYAPGSPMVMLEALLLYLEEVLGWIFLSLAYVLWVSLRWPFLRENLALRATNEPATRDALHRLIGPMMTLTEADTAEIRIAPKLYYSLLALLFWVTFIVVEDVLNEFLDDWLGSAGYLGASMIAIAIAAAFYPFHQRASKYLDSRSVNDSIEGADDLLSILRAAVRSISINLTVRGRMMPIYRRALLYIGLAIGGLILILIGIGIHDLSTERG